MKQRVGLLIALVAAAFTVAACGGGGVTGIPAGSSGLALAWDGEALQGATLIGPASIGGMHVNVLVRQQNPIGLLAYAQAVNDRTSPLYRQFLTPQEIGERFGATQQDYQNAAGYFARYHLSVSGWPQRLTLGVAGTQSSMEQAFGVKFGVYRSKDGQQFIAPIGTPSLSAAAPVVAVRDLVTLNRNRSFIVIPPRVGSAINAGESPQQIQAAFGYASAYSKGYIGSGITVGIIGTGPIDIQGGQDVDATALKSLYNLASMATVNEVVVSPSPVAVGLGISGIPTAAPVSPNPFTTPVPPQTSPFPNGFPYSSSFGTPPPVTQYHNGCVLPTCNPEDGEAQLDTQQIASLAYGATVNFYLAYNKADCFVYFPNTCATPAPGHTPSANMGQPQIGLVESDPEIQQAIADNKADVISISFGGGELDPGILGFGYNKAGQGFQPLEFAALATEGIAVFVSSGDNGDAECVTISAPCQSYPATDPNVTAVGGVNAPLNELGQLTAPITAWGTTTSLGSSGTGGGVSSIFAAPSWQATDLGATLREVPDVAMIGDPNTGVTIFTNSQFPSAQPVNLPSGQQLPGSGAFDIGGTSVSAPEAAAMWALVLQACNQTASCKTAGGTHPYRLGNAAQYFYGIYKAAAPGSSFPFLPYTNVFYDVTFGSNSILGAKPIVGPTAGPGYDETTGVGVPFAGHLIDAVVNPNPLAP